MENVALESMFGANTSVIPELDGFCCINRVKKIFKTVDDNPDDWWCSDGIKTPKTKISFYKMVDKKNWLIRVFCSLPGSWEQKWFSRAQIMEFYKNLPDWFYQDKYPTFFLCKKDENLPLGLFNEDELARHFFVVGVGHCDDINLRIKIYRLDSIFFFEKDYCRFAAPLRMNEVIAMTKEQMFELNQGLRESIKQIELE